VNGFANQSKEEYAWFQDWLTHDVAPASGNFTWVSNGPTAQNQTTSYTANSGFTVGFQGTEPNASYTWGNTTSYDIPDWKVSSLLNGTAVQWDYRSANPTRTPTTRGAPGSIPGAWITSITACTAHPSSRTPVPESEHLPLRHHLPDVFGGRHLGAPNGRPVDRALRQLVHPAVHTRRL
jgi:hypothetical protein